MHCPFFFSITYIIFHAILPMEKRIKAQPSSSATDRGDDQYSNRYMKSKTHHVPAGGVSSGSPPLPNTEGNEGSRVEVVASLPVGSLRRN